MAVLDSSLIGFIKRSRHRRDLASCRLAASERRPLDIRLPERQRVAVTLRHIEGLSNPEIAEAMEISVEAVESLTARGKRMLKAALESRKKDLGWS